MQNMGTVGCSVIINNDNIPKMVICAGYLSLGISTPFLSLGMSYMYPSLAAAKAAVISVGEEIATQGLPPEICPLVIVFTGSGNGIIYFN